jgi:hypothetical protein
VKAIEKRSEGNRETKGMRTMEDDPNGRMKAARDAMRMTTEELMTWAVGRQANDPVRQPR